MLALKPGSTLEPFSTKTSGITSPGRRSSFLGGGGGSGGGDSHKSSSGGIGEKIKSFFSTKSSSERGKDVPAVQPGSGGTALQTDPTGINTTAPVNPGVAGHGTGGQTGLSVPEPHETMPPHINESHEAAQPVGPPIPAGAAAAAGGGGAGAGLPQSPTSGGIANQPAHATPGQDTLPTVAHNKPVTHVSIPLRAIKVGDIQMKEKGGTISLFIPVSFS